MVLNDTVIWKDLDLELITRIRDLDINHYFKFMLQNMTANYLYSVRKVYEDALKDKQKQNIDKGVNP